MSHMRDTPLCMLDKLVHLLNTPLFMLNTPCKCCTHRTRNCDKIVIFNGVKLYIWVRAMFDYISIKNQQMWHLLYVQPPRNKWAMCWVIAVAHTVSKYMERLSFWLFYSHWHYHCLLLLSCLFVCKCTELSTPPIDNAWRKIVKSVFDTLCNLHN